MSDSWLILAFLLSHLPAPTIDGHWVRLIPFVLSHQDEFLFMSGGTWAQLWSGIFGAVIGAVAAAGVALLVVSLTNRHQRVLADAAMAEQGRLASVALQEQRGLADNALTEQRRIADAALAEQRRLAFNAANEQRVRSLRDLLEQRESQRQQLSEQRNEASKGRLFAAISDFSAAIAAGLNKFREGEGFDDMLVMMESAVVRIKLDATAPAFESELEEWPTLIWRLVREAHINHLEPVGDGRAPDRLAGASSALLTILTRWPRADEKTRAEMLDALTTHRKSADAESEAYRKRLFTKG